MRPSRGMTVVNMLIALALIFAPALNTAQATATSSDLTPISSVLQSPDQNAAAPTLTAAPLASPLSVSLQQSTFDAASAAGSGLVITLTVRNNLPPLLAPQLNPSANITDTIAALTAFDYSRDPNRIRQVAVSDELLGGVSSFIDADPQPSRNGNRLVWNLGDLDPYEEASISLHIDVPGSAANFTDLDSGAAVYGTHQGRMVSSAAAPARLAPDGFAAFLGCTVDANCADPYILEQAGRLGGDPVTAFEFVRDEVGFEAYAGSLRGARGVLWSAAGNATDQASLLIALLRAGGVPARYLHGTLSTANAQTLVGSMFPVASGVGGLAPAGEPLADPVNSSALLDPTRDHWWVEAYLPGSGWTQLDPSFATATLGQSFTTPQGPAAAELPDSQRHKVTVSLKVEQYNVFSVTPGSVGLSAIQPLNQTFATVELVGEPVTLGHLVSTDSSGGLVFTNYEHTYVPYLVVGLEETLYQGDAYTELLTNFPLASNPILAQWLIFTVTAPDGSTQTYEREVFDYVGYDLRQGSGAINANVARGNEPVLRETTQVTTLFSPSGVSPDALNRTYPAMVQAVFDGQAALEATDAIVAAGDFSAEEWAVLSDARVTFGRVARLAQRMSLLNFATVSDFTAAAYGEAFQVKAYPDSPRIISVAWEEDVETGVGTLSMDLRRNELSVVPYPGQTLDGLRTFNTARGLFEMSLESQILDEIGIEPVRSVAAILTEADAQNIPLGMYTVTQLDQLDALPISSIAKARITTDLTANPRHVVAVPTEDVLLGGEPAIGWLQIDMATGEIIDVQENGQHMVAVEYATLLNSSIQEVGFAMAGFGHGFAAYTFGWLGGFFTQVPIDPGNLAAAKAAAASTASSLVAGLESAIEQQCCGTDEWRDAYLGGVTLVNITIKFGDLYDYELVDIKIGGFTNGVAAAEAIIGASDPPLPSLRFSRYAPHFGSEVARSARSAPATLPAGAISANLSTASLSLLGGLEGNWSAAGRHALEFASLTASNGTVSLPGGGVLGSGAISASAVMSSATALSQSPLPLNVAVAGDGGVAEYAPAASGLAGGAQWTDYAAQLSSFQPYTLRLDDAAVTVGGDTFTGTLDLALAVPAAINGAGRAAAPTFAASAQMTLVGGGAMVGPASGSLTVGGGSPSAANGFALANFNGTATASEASANSDTATLNGTGTFFALSLSPASSTIAPTGVASFASNIAANASRTYTMTVYAPAGWATTVDGAGQVTAAPPPGATPGVYQVLVSAQSVAHPDLFASAIHEVTTTSFQGVDVTVAPDPRWSVPWGIALRDDGLAATNTGQVQLPGAAFTVDVANPSTVAHSFDVTVTGLPAGWAILDGEEGADTTTINVPAGGTGRIGLYVRPTGSLTPIGATYPFVVTASDNDGAGISDSGNGVFTMPSIPFNYLTAEPGALYTAANSSVDFDVVLQNVGNAAASFPLSAQMPAGDWSLSGLAPSVNLSAGQTNRQAVTLNVGAGALGSTYDVLLASPATGTIYTQRLQVPVRIVGPGVAAGFQGASAAQVCDAAGATSAAMQTLAYALANLETSCADGSCDLRLRDAAVDAANSAANYSSLYYPLANSAGDLTSLAAVLATHASAAVIADDIVDLGDALAALGLQVCEISQHLPSVRWRPNFNAGLPGQAVDYTLELANRGTDDTTYAVTVTLPGGVSTLNPTVAAGATYSETVAASSPTLGQFPLLAEAEATGTGVEMPGVSAAATGWLNVVDRFVQITSVTVDPPFVETGVSSTTLSIDVANVANVARDATARTELRAEGGALAYSADIPLVLAAGAPQRYQLATVDTFGWNAGLYTATVELLDADEALIPDGSGYAFLAVGQALGVSHAVAPTVLPPGNVTVTTIITTEILVDTILPDSAAEALPLWEPQGLRAAEAWNVTREAGGEVVSAADQSGVSITLTPAYTATFEVDASPTLTPTLSQRERGPEPEGEGESEGEEEVVDETIPDNGRAPNAAVTRAEQTDGGFTYGGSWTAVTNSRASGNTYVRSRTAGHTVSYGFTGDWVTLGLFGASYHGQAELFIDGASQGVIDLYRREDTAFSLLFDGLGGGAHTIALTVPGTANPKSTDEWVGIDYVDTWDGAALPDGTFEQNDPRVFLSGGWSNVNDANASGGSYIRSSAGNAWFAFSGDSFTYSAMTRNAARTVRLTVDGVYLTELDLFDWDNTPRSFSFQGFGPGLHVVQVSTQNGEGTVDAFTQPGSAPWTDPNAPAASFQRYEADHTGWLYNGEPLTVTVSTWTREVNSTSLNASRVETVWSNTAVNSAALTIDGSWAALGFLGDSQGGSAEVFLDGVSQGVVNTYRREIEPVSFTLGSFAPGNHTVSLVVQGNGRVRLDYLDVWNGVALPDGAFGVNDFDRLYLDNNWGLRTSIAPPGQYLRSGVGNAWFPFTGDTVSFQGWNDGTVRTVKLYIDDNLKAAVDLGTSTVTTPTWSFDGLGAGAHVLRVQGYRSNATIGAFIQPGSAPFYTPPAIGAFQRYEEDWPAILYNGQPYTTTVTTWARLDNSTVGGTSGGQVIWSATASDTATFAFNGVKVGVGFLGSRFGGWAEIFIDGVSQGVIDTYRNEDDFLSTYYDGLSTGPHTLVINVLGTSNPNASNARIYLDYIDVWDGAPLPDGTFEQDDSRVLPSGDWYNQTDANASGGSYGREGLFNQASMWFPFSGDSVTYQAMAHSDGLFAIAKIDGQFVGALDLFNSTTVTRTFSFDDLGAGAHVLHIQRYRGELTVDAFRQPGSAPFFTPPAIGAFHRYQEDWPAILYNGTAYNLAPTTWARLDNITSGGTSGGQVIWSATAGDTATFAFNGVEVGVGFLGSRFGGNAEIFIDGVSQGMIDTYRSEDDFLSVYYDGLAAGPHTLAINVLGASNPNASATRVYFDYIDVWDGTPLPDGTFEQDDSRVLRSPDWTNQTDVNASGGSYGREGLLNQASMWFPFNGDSVTVQAMARSDGDQFAIAKIDGQFAGYLNLYSYTTVTRTFSFDGLGAGLHGLHVQRQRGEIAVDAFRTPGSAPFFTPPSYAGIVRHEENDPAMRYNGWPYRQRPQAWFENNIGQASGNFVVGSATTNDTASLQFDGTWVNVGFRTRSNGGQAEVLIDGVSQGIVGLYSAADDVTSVQYGGLSAGPHTVEVRVVGAPDPPSTQNNVWIDYIDTYDGTAVSDSFSNANLAQHNGRVHFSDYLGTFPAANGIEGDYTGIGVGAPDANVWYSFVGDAVTFYGFTRNNNPTVDVYIDDELVATETMDYDFTESPIAFHYTGLSDGPHVMRINNASNMRVDGFSANPTALVPYLPMVEWYDDTPAGNGAPFFGSIGMVSGMAAGDINNDGVVELVFGSDTLTIWGKLFVYRADGGDSGDGDPILWTDDIGGAPVNRALIGSIALANLDGTPNSEIVVHSSKDLRVYSADGTLQWSNVALKGFDILGAPAIGNVDADPEPEIVTNADTTLAVLDGDGAVLWTTTFADYVVPPLLADMNGDGRLDIIAADYGDGSAGRPTEVRLYDYNLGAPTLEWTVPITPAIRTGGLNGLLGSHAVGDIDGQQPGGDPGPEIVISHNGNVTVLDADGSVVWNTPLEPGNPGGVSIADIDGDGEVEIVTGMKHEFAPGRTGKVYALNADGTLLWDAIAEDGTSANSSSVLDLNGDGVYEVAWTGREQGFTIFDGATGDVIFYEPLVHSITGSDHPIILDVDNDGQAEIVAASLRGPRVFGMGGAWASSRALWNQQTYHITNVNDDLSVPAVEANSWDVHNTYRTQTNEPQPLPVFGVELTHTVGISNVTVLTGTFNVAPALASDPTYGWGYQQDATEDVITRTFASLLTAMQPGEARQVAQGTAVEYKLNSGINTLLLPPLYVAAPHIIALDPAEQSTGSGTSVSYPVILSNPGTVASVYDLSVAGLPDGWWSLPASVAVPAQSSVTSQLVVTIPPGEEAAAWDFTVAVETSQGGADQAGGRLEGLGPPLEIAVMPAEQSGLTGQVLTYTLTITNLETTARSYDLSSSGLAEVSLTATLNVPAGGSADLEFTARPGMPGPNPFSITAEVAATGAAATTSAVATGVGFTSVGVSIDPGTAPAGPGSSAVLTATISNLGDVPDVYDIAVDAPAGWTAELTANGVPLSQVALTPFAFNSAAVQLSVTPPFGATPGSYPVTVSAVSQTDLPGGPAEAEDGATVQVGTRGVQVEFISGPGSLLPSQAGAWQVRITNRGSVADTYNLSVFGVFTGAAQLTPASVSLNPGANQVVQLSAGPLPFALPGASLLGVTARSTGNSAIIGEDTTPVIFGGQEAVEVGWQPVSQTISQTLEATYMLLITNTGNIETTYAFDVTAPNLQVMSQQLEQLSIPPHMTAANLVTLRASQAGVFPFSGEASSTSSPAADTAGATLTVVCPGNADVNGDGDVTVLDITAVAERWDAFELGNYSFVHDLNCDGAIDIVDIQTAAGAFGT